MLARPSCSESDDPSIRFPWLAIDALVAHASLIPFTIVVATARRRFAAFATASHALLAELARTSPAVFDGPVVVDAFFVGVA